MQQVSYLAIEKSPLFGLNRLRDLANLLSVTPGKVRKLTSDQNYREWFKRQPGKKPRLIEEPKADLANAQRRIKNLLADVETPNWLKSGKRAISPIDNARVHQGRDFLINVDIASFYQSTKREFLYQALCYHFCIAPDVASHLASLLTYKGHIPTGTSTSQLSAFWAYRRTFEKIERLSQANNIRMSLWVDDITFSSNSAFPSNWVQDVNGIFENVDLKLKKEKTKKYDRQEYRIVTGSAISPDGELRVRNAKRLEILEMLAGRRVEEINISEARKLLGKLSSQRQIEPDFYDDMTNRCKVHLRRISASSKGQ